MTSLFLKAPQAWGIGVTSLGLPEGRLLIRLSRDSDALLSLGAAVAPQGSVTQKGSIKYYPKPKKKDNKTTLRVRGHLVTD